MLDARVDLGTTCKRGGHATDRATAPGSDVNVIIHTDNPKRLICCAPIVAQPEVYDISPYGCHGIFVL